MFKAIHLSVLMILTGCAASPVAPAPEHRPPHILGTYTLYRVDNAKGRPVGQMTVRSQDGNRFVVGNAEGPDRLHWEGRGELDGDKGHYDWTFKDGRTGRTDIEIDGDGRWRGQVRGAGIDWDYVALPQGSPDLAHPPFPTVKAFRSVRHVRRSFPEKGDPPMAAAAHDFIGAIEVPPKGVCLMDILDQGVGDGEGDAKPTRFVPGIYRVESVRDTSYDHENYSVLFSCMYREGIEPVRWVRGQAHGGGKHGLAIIQANAYARWETLVDAETRKASIKGKEATSADYPIYNRMTDLMQGHHHQMWDELGFRFNKPDRSEGVFIPAPASVDFYFGLDRSGRRVALMCRWH